MMMGANKITVVALGNKAHAGGDQDDQSEQKSSAAAFCDAQKQPANPLENTGCRQDTRHHHPPKEEGDGSPRHLLGAEHVILREDPRHNQGTHAQERRQGHVDHIDGDCQDHAGKDTEGQIGLELGHLSALANPQLLPRRRIHQAALRP
jgi:hypothetical protein